MARSCCHFFLLRRHSAPQLRHHDFETFIQAQLPRILYDCNCRRASICFLMTRVSAVCFAALQRKSAHRQILWKCSVSQFHRSQYFLGISICSMRGTNGKGVYPCAFMHNFSSLVTFKDSSCFAYGASFPVQSSEILSTNDSDDDDDVIASRDIPT